MGGIASVENPDYKVISQFDIKQENDVPRMLAIIKKISTYTFEVINNDFSTARQLKLDIKGEQIDVYAKLKPDGKKYTIASFIAKYNAKYLAFLRDDNPWYIILQASVINAEIITDTFYAVREYKTSNEIIIDADLKQQLMTITHNKIPIARCGKYFNYFGNCDGYYVNVSSGIFEKNIIPVHYCIFINKNDFCTIIPTAIYPYNYLDDTLNLLKQSKLCI